MYDFNPRSREGSDAKSYLYSTTPFKFQSTLPRRERQSLHAIVKVDAKFQSTLPRRERRCWAFLSRKMQKYFNPRSREGSDREQEAALFQMFEFQSTLPRRERRFSNIFFLFQLRFQSTLPRRERLNTVLVNFSTIRFQSTLPRRERLILTVKIRITKPISIHAPAKGATKAPILKLTGTSNFNPRSREGSDETQTSLSCLA